MSIPPGTRLGPYEILAPIGAGGMGEVYRARDARLNRDVAIKILSRALAADPAALARFEREAQSVAQLSHPNILNIFDFGKEGSIAYAAMELLEGETLRDRLAAGALPARRAIECAVQIAHGLAAAHDKGIAHRDLKPENLFLTHDDHVKILDFGLAKPLDPGGAGATSANTVGTAAGTVMGTVGYMAPEQVRGQHTDHRSDIFAFGCVLYEMLTGRRAFSGDSPADTISAILNSDPPDLEAAVGGGVAPALDRIVRRCLEKKPELRFHSAHDLAFALETLSARGSGAVQTPVGPPPVPARRGMRGLVLGGGALLLATAAGVGWLLGHRSVEREEAWQTFTAVTDAAGEETFPSLSPDGSTVAYATRARGTWDVFVQRVGGRTAIAIAADPERDESSPAFSPDGVSIAYHEADEDGGIFVVGATGESARRLTQFGVHPAWSPDGARIVFSTEEIWTPYGRLGSQSRLWIVDSTGGEPRLVEGTGDAAQPSWSPDNGRIAYWSNTNAQRDIYTIPSGGGTRTPVMEDAALDWSPVWSPDGRFIYFSSDRGGAMNLWRVRIDEATGGGVGVPEPVTTGVQASAEQPSFSRNGTRLAFRSRVSAVNPIAIPIDPMTLRAGVPVLLDHSNSIRHPSSLSRDGTRLALTNLGDLREDLFTSAIDGTNMRRVTDDVARDRAPAWSADGKSLFFYSNRSGQWDIWSVGADGSGLRKVVAIPGAGSLLYPLVSRAGDRVVLSSSVGGVYVGRTAAGVSPEGNAEQLPDTRANGNHFVATDWSSDGTQLVGVMRAPNGRPVAVAVYDMRTSKLVRQFPGSTASPRWFPGGRHICYLTLKGDALIVRDSATNVERRIGLQVPASSLQGVGLVVAPDGRTIYYGGARTQADIWVVERK